MTEETEQDELAPEPIPTYEEFLENEAKKLRSDPLMFLLKGVVGFVQFLQTREVLFINLLKAKNLLTDYEYEEYFGGEAHAEAQKQGLKELTKHLCQLATAGNLVSPFDDKKVFSPDDVFVIVNDILDLNGTGWDGRTVETIAEMRGEGGSLRATYEREVAVLKATNAIRVKRREKREERSRFEEELARRQAVDRHHRLKIYLSKCNIDGKPVPSEEEQQKMLDGETPIPEKP